MTPKEALEETRRRWISAALTTIHTDIRLLSRDELMALDHAVTNEFIRQMKEDKGMEAQP